MRSLAAGTLGAKRELQLRKCPALRVSSVPGEIAATSGLMWKAAVRGGDVDDGMSASYSAEHQQEADLLFLTPPNDFPHLWCHRGLQ